MNLIKIQVGEKTEAMRKILIIPFLLFFLGMIPVKINAQKTKVATADVSGHLYDDAGTPLPGILLKAGKSSAIAISDVNGAFTINAGLIDHIGISEEGYNAESFGVFNGNLESDTIVLQRINAFSENSEIEFPFGSSGINQSTGSVVRISGDQVERHPSGQVMEALTGLIPGLQIMQSSSRPGSENFSVRYHGKSVQVLIDGFPQELQVSLREVEEVIMMKGAAATAMMGDLGADGILLINTKKGKSGPRKLSFEYETGYGTPTAMGDFMNSYDYAQTINASLLNDGLQPIYGADALAAYQDGSDPVRYPDVDYYGEFFRENVSRQQFNGQFSGGTENSRYFANFAYNGVEGLEKMGERRSGKDLVFRTNLDLDISKNVNLDASLVGSFQQQRLPKLTTGSMFGIVSSYQPNAFPLMLGDSIYITSRDRPTNMLFEMTEGGYVETSDRRMNMNVGLNIDLNDYIEGLSFRTKVAVDVWNQISLDLDHRSDEYELLFETLPNGTDTMIINQTVVERKELNPGNNGDAVQRKYNVFGILNYDRTFDEHALNANLLFYQYIFEVDGRLNNSIGQMYNFRANYSFKNKYSLEAVLAYVGTNKLYESNRFRLFPTLGAAWVVSEESFLENSSLVDYLKLRGSYGQQGYNRSSNFYPFWNEWDDASNARFGTYPSNNRSTTTFFKDQTGNPDLVWPVKTTINIGTDALLLKRAVALHLDYFYTMTSGEFARYPISDMSGGNGFNALYNLESLSGSGVELGVNYSKTINNFSYSIGLNGAYFVEKNEILSEPAYPDENLRRVGDPSDAIYGLDADGLFADATAAADADQTFGPVFAEDVIYQDYNGNGFVDNTDVHSIGNSDPRFNYGFNLFLKYKGFSIYANCAGFTGFDVDISNQVYYQQNGYDSRATAINAALPNGNAMPRLTVLGSTNNYRNSTYWLVDGSCFRLENVGLAYKSPRRISTKLAMSGAKIYVRGRNLFTLSAFDKFDPEMLEGGYSDYPIFREFSAGLALSF